MIVETPTSEAPRTCLDHKTLPSNAASILRMVLLTWVAWREYDPIADKAQRVVGLNLNWEVNKIIYVDFSHRISLLVVCVCV